MFSSAPNYTKLKTHLRLAINRLKLLEKKKSELAQKSRKEIADFIRDGKAERAKIRVEHIIREDYLVEAMEIVEMYCDLLIARFGLITQMKELDEGLAEAIASLIWVAPRLQADIPELKIVNDLLTSKYGKPYADDCRAETNTNVSTKLKHKLSIQSPAKKLVEHYLIEIAACFNVYYEPDEEVLQEGAQQDGLLIDLSNENRNNLGGGGGGMPIGFIGYPGPPPLPEVKPFVYPTLPSHDNSSATAPPPSMPYGAPFSYNIPPQETKENNTNYDLPQNFSMLSPDDNAEPNVDKPSVGGSKMPNDISFPEIPNLPSVPSDTPTTAPRDDIDFDDLTKRFEALKKKK